tara:strand:+ start:1191 stop:1358 length:168 start_codon:yes stop_codon:yes gene_type:complete
MKKSIGKYELELTGSMVTIKVNGELMGAKEVNPNEAVDGFNTIYKTLEKVTLSKI